ncbi:DUF1120 domain-containing protein [Pseudomonas sp. MDT1-16]
MNFPKKALLGSLLLLSATSAFAVDTADLRVIGTIAPTACTPTFSGGGVIDYGLIPSASLSPTVRTSLQRRTVSYTIACDAPIAVGTSWSDNRASSAAANDYSFGLGLQGSNSIGDYSIRDRLVGATGDGAPVDVITSTNGGVTWRASTDALQVRGDALIHGYAVPGTLVPAAYSNFAGIIEVAPSISATSTLDLTSTITLDGLSTMTVRYL